MRARRHQLSFDRLDARVVLDSGAAVVVGANIGGSLAPRVGPLSPAGLTNQTPIPDPGLMGDGSGSSGSGTPTIPDPGLLG